MVSSCLRFPAFDDTPDFDNSLVYFYHNSPVFDEWRRPQADNKSSLHIDTNIWKTTKTKKHAENPKKKSLHLGLLNLRLRRHPVE